MGCRCWVRKRCCGKRNARVRGHLREEVVAKDALRAIGESGHAPMIATDGAAGPIVVHTGLRRNGPCPADVGWRATEADMHGQASVTRPT